MGEDSPFMYKRYIPDWMSDKSISIFTSVKLPFLMTLPSMLQIAKEFPVFCAVVGVHQTQNTSLAKYKTGHCSASSPTIHPAPSTKPNPKKSSLFYRFYARAKWIFAWFGLVEMVIGKLFFEPWIMKRKYKYLNEKTK
jgi:hypothetical protein